MEKLLISVLACCVVLSFTSVVGAVDLRSGSAVTITGDRAVTEDVLAAANQGTVSSPVQGDVTAVGQSIRTSGAVTGSVTLVANSISVTGSVGNDAWLAGSSVSLNSRIADNAYVAGSNVELGPESSVAGDLLAAGSMVTVLGDVTGDIRAAGGTMRIEGTVGGDARLQAGRVELGPNAVVRGDLIYKSPNRAEIAPGARVLGRTVYTQSERQREGPGFGGVLLFWLWWLAAGIVLGAVLLALFPAATGAAVATVRDSFWLSFGVGLVALVATPLLCLLVAITLVGIPLAVAVFLVYLVLLHIAGVFTALALGEWVLQRFRRPSVHPLLVLALGLLILGILMLIPFVGAIVVLVAVATGLGAFLMSWWRRREAAGRERADRVPETGEQLGPA